MHLFKRSNGIYYIRYKDKLGNWQSTSTNTKIKKIALEHIMNFNNEVEDSLFPFDKYEIKFDEFAIRYLEYSQVHHSPSNTIRIKYVINNFEKFSGDILLNAIDHNTIEEYLRFRIGKVRPTTLNIELRALKSMLNTAINWNLISSNPMMKIKQIRTNDNIPKMFTHSEINLIIENAKPSWLKNIVILAVNTGMRRNELINLRWKDVDVSKKYLIVRNTNSFTIKNRTERVIPINDNSLKVLRKINAENEYVFVGCNGQKIYPNYLTQCFRDCLSQLSIRNDRSFHSLRHTFASWLVQRGVSIYEISKLLGHSDIRVTQIYSHLQPENLKNAVELLN
jgi:integrase